MAKELDELAAACAALAAAENGAIALALEAVRAASRAVNTLAIAVGDVHREAQDCEYEPVTPAVRAHLDGCLLQRTRSVQATAARTTEALRTLAIGLRDLEADATRLVALAAPAPPA